MRELQLQDIQENIVIIKLNKSYHQGMSALELYDITRGSWKRKIESVKDAEYALAVYDSMVLEVYKIEKWSPSEEVIRETIPFDPARVAGRITFSGVVADESIREKYVGTSVKALYKWGEADPVKYFPKYDMSSNTKKYDILDAADHIEFSSIYEAINCCIGTSYTGWMKACYPASNGDFNFRMWFPKLAKEKDGKKVSAAFDCVNTISSDWNQVVFEDLKRDPSEEADPESIYRGLDLIFAKEPAGGYLFRGCFKYDEASSGGNKFISKRVATRVRLIGNPVTNIELLDGSSKKSINVAIAPKGTIETNEGTKNICANCEYALLRAQRCPNCGQLIKYDA